MQSDTLAATLAALACNVALEFRLGQKVRHKIFGEGLLTFISVLQSEMPFTSSKYVDEEEQLRSASGYLDLSPALNTCIYSAFRLPGHCGWHGFCVL